MSVFRRVTIGLLLLAAPALATEPPIPQLALWESHMLTYGASHCAFMGAKDPGTDSALGDTYYDALRVFHQIAEYTGDTATWLPCAEVARVIYGDNYVTENNGGVPGYWNFTEGFRIDWEVNAIASSKAAAIALSIHSSFCDVGHDYSPTDAGAAREVSYCLNAVMNAKALGESVDSRITVLKTELLSYIDEWFISKTYRCGTISPYNPCDPVEATGKYYIQPFMVGIVADALIRYWKVSGDALVEPAITTALDWLTAEAWVSADNAWWYDNWKDAPEDAWPAKAGSPDLNLLIVPAYAWLYKQNLTTSYRDTADAGFAAGVLGAYLEGTKQYNQNYQMSFDYVAERSTDPVPDPPLEGVIQLIPLDTSVNVTYGAVGMDYGGDCTVTLKDSGGSTLDTKTTTEGLARRVAIFTGLTASTAYKIAVDCADADADLANTDFTTKATPSAGDRTVPIQLGAPTTYATAARATIEYDDNAALSSSATVQNTSCSGACTVELTIPAGLWYYRVIRQTSGDVALHTSSVQPLQITEHGSTSTDAVSRWSSLVAGWNFDESSDGSGAVQRDDVLGTYNLTDNNTTASTTGILGNSALFVAADNTSLSNAGGIALSGTFTWSYWIYVNTAGGSQAIVSTVNSYPTQINYLGYLSTLAPRFLVAGADDIEFAASSSISSGAWHFVVGWWDGTKAHISVDDGTVYDSGVLTGSVYSGATALIFGDAAATFANFDGRLDEAYVFAGVKSSAWRTEMYNAGVGRTYPN